MDSALLRFIVIFVILCHPLSSYTQNDRYSGNGRVWKKKDQIHRKGVFLKWISEISTRNVQLDSWDHPFANQRNGLSGFNNSGPLRLPRYVGVIDIENGGLTDAVPPLLKQMGSYDTAMLMFQNSHNQTTDNFIYAGIYDHKVMQWMWNEEVWKTTVPKVLMAPTYATDSALISSNIGRAFWYPFQKETKLVKTWNSSLKTWVSSYTKFQNNYIFGCGLELCELSGENVTVVYSGTENILKPAAAFNDFSIITSEGEDEFSLFRLSRTYAMKWMSKISGVLNGPPSISPNGDYIFLTANESSVLGFSTEDGNKSLQLDIMGTVQPLITLGRYIYVVKDESTILAFDYDGTLRWKYLPDTPYQIGSLTVLENDLLAFIGLDTVSVSVFLLDTSMITPVLLWQLKIPKNGQVLKVTPISVSNDNSFHFSYEWNSPQKAPQVTIHSIRQFGIQKLTPYLLLKDENFVEVQHEIEAPETVESVHCVVYKDFKVNVTMHTPSEITASNLGVNSVHCHVKELHKDFKNGELLSLYLQVKFKGHTQMYASNAINFQYCKEPIIRGSNSLGTPILSNSSLVVEGNNFETYFPPVIWCRFQTGSFDLETKAELLDGTHVMCGSFFAHQPMELTVSISIDNQRTWTPTSLKYYVYQPFLVKTIYSPSIPIDRFLSFSGTGQYLDPFINASSLRCGFAPIGKISSIEYTSKAECRNSGHFEEPLYECMCQGVIEVKEQPDKFRLFVSVNDGQLFNNTNHLVSFYEQPVIASVHPNRAKASGGEIIVLQGNGFFESDQLLCKFADDLPFSKGKIIYPERYIQCVTPVVPLTNNNSIERNQSIGLDFSSEFFGNDSNFRVVQITISENGIDWTPSNVSFTFTRLSCPAFDCNQNGECDIKTGNCICFKGWKGESCDVRYRLGYWYILMPIVVTFPLIVVFSLGGLWILFKLRAGKYKGLVNERKYNDISTAL